MTDAQFTPLTPVVLEALGAPFCRPRAQGEVCDLRSDILIMRIDEDTVFLAGVDRRDVAPELREAALNEHGVRPVLVDVFGVQDATASTVEEVVGWCRHEGMAFTFDRKHPREPRA